MEYEIACDRICDGISHLLLEAGRPTPGMALTAARATRDVADALHHARGVPDDPRWFNAVASLDDFLARCKARGLERSAALRELQAFASENAA